MDYSPPSTADYAASDAQDALKRMAIAEKRLELLRAACMGEQPMTREEFAKAWAECVPKPPAPIDYSALYGPGDPFYQKPRTLLGGSNPLDGTRLLDNS